MTDRPRRDGRGGGGQSDGWREVIRLIDLDCVCAIMCVGWVSLAVRHQTHHRPPSTVPGPQFPVPATALLALFLSLVANNTMTIEKTPSSSWNAFLCAFAFVPTGITHRQKLSSSMIEI